MSACSCSPSASTGSAAWARVIAWLLWFGYVPLGMITFVVPVEIVAPFALARTAFFVLGFALGGIYFLRDKETSAPVAAEAQ